MIYLDTSALVPLFILEPKSEALLSWIGSCHDPMAVSEWGLVEFALAASIKVRTRQTSAQTARQAAVKLEAFVRDHCQVALPDRAAFRRAVELASSPKPALRAGDALHLAIALSLNATSLLCLDDAMVAAAHSLGLPVPGL